MNALKLSIQLNQVQPDKLNCTARKGIHSISFVYYPLSCQLIVGKGYLGDLLSHCSIQLLKVLKSALRGTACNGQKINCVFIENFRFLNGTDYQQYIRVDRREGNLQITTSITESSDIPQLFADGSFSGDKQQSGFAGVIDYPTGQREVYTQSLFNGSSNLMELLAVLEGLQRLQKFEKIRVNTDSRFVIRGLAQWIHFWKLNQWQTAYGREVKFAGYWKTLDVLCAGKCIELKWIKAHAGHPEQQFCHKLAKQQSGRKCFSETELGIKPI